MGNKKNRELFVKLEVLQNHYYNKKAHGQIRERFSLFSCSNLKFADFELTKKSENAFLYVFKFF